MPAYSLPLKISRTSQWDYWQLPHSCKTIRDLSPATAVKRTHSRPRQHQPTSFQLSLGESFLMSLFLSNSATDIKELRLRLLFSSEKVVICKIPSSCNYAVNTFLVASVSLLFSKIMLYIQCWTKWWFWTELVNIIHGGSYKRLRLRTSFGCTDYFRAWLDDEAWIDKPRSSET